MPWIDRIVIRGENMKKLKPYLSKLAPGLALVLAGTLAGCSNFNKAADVSGDIRTSMEQAGLKDVKVSQDRDKGIVTLRGNVTSDDDKAKAESLARSMSGSQVVANQIAVLPVGAENLAHKVNVDLDEGIESNLDAALIKDRLHDSVKYSVKNHVVTLTGDVNSQSKRARAEQVAAAVLNVDQVVNELQVKKQKATTTN
jgi:hyperosmotically inducible periplasmic protein